MARSSTQSFVAQPNAAMASSTVVAAALDNATHELQEAVAKVKSGAHAAMEVEESTPHSSATQNPDDEYEAALAAFMSRSQKQKKLPVESWASLVVDLENGAAGGNEKWSPAESDEVAVNIADVDDLAKHFLEEAKKNADPV